MTVGSDLTYTLVVTNISLITATDVTVVDTLPAGFTYFSASGQYSADDLGQHAHLQPGHLQPKASDTITIVGEVTAAAGSTITNTATVSGSQTTSVRRHVERDDDRCQPAAAEQILSDLGVTAAGTGTLSMPRDKSAIVLHFPGRMRQ